MKTYVVGQVPSGYAPLPPENVLINGARYPADISGQYTISWAPNPREHVHGPAVSGDETYTLRLYDETDTLRRTVTGITGNSYTWSTEAADSGFTGVAATALLHFDGVNNSTSIIDDVGNAWTANGDTKIKTAQSKFGGSSLGGGLGASTNNVSSGINGIAAGDFTLETWVYLSTSGEDLYPFIIGDDTTGRCQLFIYNRRLIINPSYGASDVYLSGANAVPLSLFAHIAYVRKSGVIKGYVNGVTDGASLTNANSLGNANGVRVNTGSSGSFVDELRYINGSALYDGNFTPPSTPFSLVGRYNSSIRAELETVRGGVTSYQKQVISSTRSVTTP